MGLKSNPKSPNVTKVNPFDVVYIRGNEFTDDSKRISFDTETDHIHVQKRNQGAWQDGAFGVGTNTLTLGQSIGISAFGLHLATERTDGSDRRLYTYNRIDSSMPELVQAEIIGPLLTHVVINSDDSGEFIGKLFEGRTTAPFSVMQEHAYFKIGSVAATKPVRLRVYEGTDASGIINWDYNFPASEFGPANTEVRVSLPGFIESENGSEYYVTYESEEDFSLRTNAAKTAEWLAFDLRLLSHSHVLSTRQWMPDLNYDVGQWNIDHPSRKIYEANVTGIQTGTFEDNADKWDKLISVQGFDRIITTVLGEVAPDIQGNLVISN